ncbi:transmembrane protein [Heterostelium album PN500]|uniref:Transmembrane protein n=1 Tax=Heterostelium pallidum (strain ATCC 26659 / Pp 5 / PN500) TaxID=670386 RepID=D3BLE3_HETP5|nr:transmembrane protein [Heterostelium album PN500]EFA77877.1 transmembrane protein [Heterostelium album PN500]|eukprot:XP_020430005.1 transmembrane protein [Heterostelium album PN500]
MDNTTTRRLKQIQGHFSSPQSVRVLPPFKSDNRVNLVSMWKQMTTLTKTGAMFIPPLATYYIYKLLKSKTGLVAQLITQHKDIDSIIKEISGNNTLDNIVKLAGKIIGLAGIYQISQRMQTYLGVKLTFSRSYQVMLTISSIMETILTFVKLPQKWGPVFLIVSVIYTMIYIRILYLTLVHNKKIESLLGSNDRCVRGDNLRNTQGIALNIPGLGAWGSVVALTLWVWLKEARRLVQSTGGILSMTSFILSAVASMRVGLRAAMTSFPGLTPYEGSSAVVVAIILGALPLIPSWSLSEWSRTLLTGYLSIIVSMSINSYFAWKRPNAML